MRISSTQNRRVVVTGLGVVSSLGIGWQEFWKNLLAGKSGISPITTFNITQYEHRYGGEVKNFDPTKFMSQKRANTIGRATQMTIAAAKLAVTDAHISLSMTDKRNIAVCVGTTGGERRLIEMCNRDRILNRKSTIAQESFVACATENLASGINRELGLQGYMSVLSTACAAGNYAIGLGFDLLRSGRFDYALVGGVDSFSQMVHTGFSRLNVVAPERCQPFDKNRKGMIPAEGAGILFLESLEMAQKRQACIYAEILGYGMSCDAYDMTEPSVIGVTKVLQKALKNSKVDADQIDYISAHGTGTIENDAAECLAFNRVFGKRTSRIPVSSIKSMLGHTMGAASALGAIACCLAIKNDQIPPTINHEKDDPQCRIDCVPNKRRKKELKIVLNTSQAFGGNNACVVLVKK